MSGCRVWTANSTQSYLATTPATTFASINALSYCGWVYRSAAASRAVVASVNYINSIAFLTALYWFEDNNVYHDVRSGGYGYYASTATGWHHLAMVYDGTQTGNENRMKGYYDGVAQTLTFSGTIPATTPNFLSGNLDIGRVIMGISGSTYTGNAHSHTHVFLRAITAAEVVDVMNNPYSYRPNLLNHHPIYGDASPEPNHAGGTAGTVNGTCAASVMGPPVTYG